MTGAGPQPDRCGHWWVVDRLQHTCWEPPGHSGEHRCKIGPCRKEPTTTPRERAS